MLNETFLVALIEKKKKTFPDCVLHIRVIILVTSFVKKLFYVSEIESIVDCRVA